MEDRISVLTYPVRFRVLAKYGGQLAMMVSLLALLPLGFALLKAEWPQAVRYGVLSAGLLLGGGMMARLAAPEDIRDHEALTITAMAFLLTPLLMAWPLTVEGIPTMDALFEAISGVTTTGLSTLGGVQHRPDIFLFARAWMQWFGGLGIVVLSVALLMRHGAAARRLAEPIETGETLVATARTHAQHVLVVYLILTLLGRVLIWPLIGDGFTALVHVLAAVSTGGFSNFDASLGNMDKAAAVAIKGLSFLGAVSLPLYWRIFHLRGAKGFLSLKSDVELRALIVACVTVGSLLTLLAWWNGVSSPWYHGFIMGVSAQTTTGFSSVAVADMDSASKLVMIVSMLVGGSVGSSAGGFKLLRLLILIRFLQFTIRRSALPSHAVAEPYLAGQKLEANDILRALVLILIFIVIVILSWLPFVLLGYEPIDALFEVVSACGTVGLSSGITRPELEPVLKGILCFDMIAGRLEVIALLVVLYPRTWIGRRSKQP